MKRFLLAFLLAALPALPQFSSAVQGTVTDQTGATVPDATVSVTNTSTGIVRDAKTSGEGFYRVSTLGPGTYTVRVEKTGFRSETQQSLELAINAVSRVDFTITPGSVSERVEVTATAPEIETEQGRVTGEITGKQIRELPISGRNVLNLVALQPGVVGRGISSGLYSGGGSDTFSGETAPSVYASGQRFEGNNYTLDDTSVNGDARNGVTNVVPNAESVEEVRVVANNFSAVDGRNPGAQIQMLTKAGTNQFHGLGAYYFTNNTLAARSVFDPAVLPGARKHLFDFAGGGPIIRNRTFFFASYEGLRQGGARATQAVVETPQFRSLVTQRSPNSIGAYILNNSVPAANPSSGFRDVGSPGANGRWSSTLDGIPDLGTVFYIPTIIRNGNQFSVRLDHELLPGKDRLYGSYYRTTNNTLSGGVRPAFNYFQAETTTFANINETHTFSPDKVNEFRAGIMQLIGRPETRKQLQIPTVNVTGLSGISGALYPSGWWQTNYSYKDIFSWVRSTHTIKMGGELRIMRGAAQNTSNYIPTYNFNNLVDFANDTPFTEQRLVNPASGQPATVFTQLRQREWALFIEDDWKVSKRLTLNLGLRYENFGTFWDKQNSLRNFVFGPGSSPFERMANGKVDYVNQFYPTDPNNFGPRIGFALDPTGSAKWAIRGGFGVTNDRISTLPTENYRSNPPLVAQANLGTPYRTSFLYSLGDPSKPNVGYPVDPALQLGLDSRNGINGARATLQAVDPNLRTPYIYNWFFGIQHEFAGRTVLDVNYIGSAGHKLYNSVNLNRYAGDLLDGTFNGINPSFGAINMVQATSNSIYHGATVSIRKRFGSQLNAQGSYTFGKAIDDTDGETGTTAWQNAYNRRAERALAGFDTRHRLTFNANWEMPFFRSPGTNGFVSSVLGGWQLTGFGIVDSGQPFNILNSAAFNNGGDYNRDNNTGDRPNAPLTSIQMRGFSEQQFLNGVFAASVFPTPTPGTDGTLGRNVFGGPHFFQVDASLAKRFSITERFSALFRADAYNVFNHVNLMNPNFDLATPGTFGRVTSQNTPRYLQVSLKLQF